MREELDPYDDTPPQGSARAAILVLLGVLGFFTFLAVAIPLVRSHGGDINTFFFVVLGALASAIIVPVLINVVLKTLHLKGKSRRELFHSFVGYTPMNLDEMYPHEVEAMMVEATTSAVDDRAHVPGPNARTLVPYTNRSVAPYEAWNEEPWDEDDDMRPDDEDVSDALPVLIERGGLPLTETFQPDPRSMTCQNISIVGVRRFGKSNAIAVLLRCLARLGFPIVIFDSEGEYEELARTQHLPNGGLVGSEEMRSDVPEGIRFRSIDTATAYNFGQLVLERCCQVIITLKSWDENQAAEIMSEMILGMEEWAQQQPTHKRIPFYIVIDEITKWVPQNQGESSLSKEARKMVQHALFDVATRRGGKRGFGLIVAGQKSADIDKRIFQGTWKFIFCQTEKPDLDRCKASPLNLDPDEVKALQPGESFVFCPQNPSGMYVKWPLAPVELGGKSPSLENLQAHLRRITSTSRNQDSMDEPVSVSARLRKTQADVQPAVQQRPPTSNLPTEARRGHTTKLASELQAALDAYRPGMTYHELGKVLRYNDADARTLFRELQQRGLLHATGSEGEQETAGPEVPPQPQKPAQASDLERALQAYEQGHTTINALALALGMSPWNVRPLHTQVRKVRENAG